MCIYWIKYGVFACLIMCVWVCEELFIFGSSFVNMVMIIVGVCCQTVEHHFMEMCQDKTQHTALFVLRKRNSLEFK